MVSYRGLETGRFDFFEGVVAHLERAGLVQSVNLEDDRDHHSVARPSLEDSKVYFKEFLNKSKKRVPDSDGVYGGVCGAVGSLCEGLAGFRIGSSSRNNSSSRNGVSSGNGSRIANAGRVALLSTLCVVFAGSPALAQKVDPDSKGYLDYDEISHRQTSGILQMRAQKALWAGDYHRAIRLCEQSMEHDTDDADTHVVYAEALEAKLKHQTEKDPELFRKCVESWLKVYRNQVGEERGMTAKGIGIGMDRFYADDDRGGKAKLHLIKLTGYVPKFWETNDKYLTRVLAPATTSVTATIRPSASASSSSSASSSASNNSSASTNSSASQPGAAAATGTSASTRAVGATNPSNSTGASGTAKSRD